MFKKLLSNLPFNPSLINQVSFYASRMHQEQKIRRMGLILIVLAMGVQMMAVVSPPERTLAGSTNDVVRDGFTSKAQAVSQCRNNTQQFAIVLSYYGVDCNALEKASTVETIKSTDYNKELDSLGRNPQPATNPKNGKPSNQYEVNISGAGRFYMKNLWYWDSGSYSTYKVLSVTNKFGQKIMILFSCGNIVTIGKYTPPPAPAPVAPQPKDVCPNRPGDQYTIAECDVCPNVPGEQNNVSDCYPCPEAKTDNSATACITFDKKARNDTQNIPDANGTTAKPNDVITYTLSVKNNGTTDIVDFVVEENLNDVLEYANVVDLSGGKLENGVVTWPKSVIAAGQTIEKKIVVKVKPQVPETPVAGSDPGSYDLIMTNVFYSKSVNIKLPCSIAKCSEIVTATLPKTGPGTTLAIGFAVTFVATYFFARTRLVAEELEIIKTEYSSGGL